ncbi:hypothetical protein NBRC116592_13040 [Colwellia sp. KU-HH00111]|uniref:hypothetical protein n=1 Tax=Colwellia sp. KU-HH00111 TaxID=3127652 RepID=UPI00310265BB
MVKKEYKYLLLGVVACAAYGAYKMRNFFGDWNSQPTKEELARQKANWTPPKEG